MNRAALSKGVALPSRLSYRNAYLRRGGFFGKGRIAHRASSSGPKIRIAIHMFDSV
jgi:hypothetical protein